jgi:hypothetical protein
LFSALPKVAKFFKLRLFDEKVHKFFDDLLLGSMEYREKNNIVIPDIAAPIRSHIFNLMALNFNKFQSGLTKIW